MNARLISVQVGQVAPLGPQGIPSAFVKRPVAGRVEIGLLGLAGDTQADPRYHGGPDKAVYGYAADNYDAWGEECPEHVAMLTPGAFGENLTISGLTEDDICLGDVHAIGDVRLQVCQPREPCFKLAMRFADKFMVKRMVLNRRSGWYYRVLEPGRVMAGDAVTLAERPHPDYALGRLIDIAYGYVRSREAWAALGAIDAAAEDWRERARERS